MGAVAQGDFSDGAVVSGLFVQRDFDLNVFASEELPMFSDLRTTSIQQMITVDVHHKFSAIRVLLQQMFDEVVEEEADGQPIIKVAESTHPICSEH